MGLILRLMTPRLWLAVAFIVVYVGTWTHGRVTGIQIGAEGVRQEQQAALDDLNADLRMIERGHREQVRGILEEQAAMEQYLMELANEAAQDPNADRPAFGADSVRRLNAIR